MSPAAPDEAARSAVELAQALVRIDTINPPGRETACAALLAARLEDAGFAVALRDFADGRRSLVAFRGDPAAGRPLCLTGHLDTVPLGAAPWSVDPFGAEIVGDRLYGRGTSDMKAGVAALVVAAERLAAELGEGPGVVLVLTAGEETGCEGARHLCRSPELLGAAGAIVVAEPTENRPLVGHKGALWLTARATGRTAHGAMPERGVNAVYKAARMATKLEDFGFNHPPHEGLGSPTLNVGSLHGGKNVNSVPDLAELGIDVRSLPGMDHGRIREDLTRYLAPDLESLEVMVDLPAVWTDPADPWVRRVYAAVASRTGAEPRPGGAVFFTDACILQPACAGAPTVILGPGDPALAHQTDESCSVARIGEAVGLYAALIRDWQAGSPGKSPP